MKQIVEKIEQNSKFIENERRKSTFALSDFKQIQGFETQIRNKGTPLNTFYESWNKVKTIKKNKEATSNEKIGDYNLPLITKSKKNEKKTREGPVELFPSDSSESEAEEKSLGEKKRKRGKRGGKNVNKKIVDHSGPVDNVNDGEKDIVEDLKLSDW